MASFWKVNLKGVPVEINVKIFRLLDISSVFKLASTSEHLRRIFVINRASILLHVLKREFSPFDELLQAYVATEQDLQSTGSVCAPKRIIFKKQSTDTGLVLAEGSSRSVTFNHKDFFEILNAHSIPGSVSTRSNAHDTTILRESDISSVLKLCGMVRKWEELFPRLRFMEYPADCRFLRPHEKERLRRALYRWWLYAIHFHGGFDRPRSGLPEPFVDDVRSGQLRMYSTSGLYELLDLQVTVEDLIKCYFFPALLKDADLGINHESHVDDSWAHVDPNVRERVLRTYAKLGPDHLLHYFENLYSFSKLRLITDIKIRCPGFTYDQASLRDALMAVLRERAGETKEGSTLKGLDSEGGILDFHDSSTEAMRFCLNNDGKLDGALPPKAKFVRPKSYHSPRGDDGSSMDEEAIDAARYTNPIRMSSRSRDIWMYASE